MGRLLEGLGLWWRSLGDGKVLPRGVLGSSAFMGLGLSSIGAAAVTAVLWVALMGKGSGYDFTSGHRSAVLCGCWVALRYVLLLLVWDRAQQRGVPVPSQ